MPPAAPYRRARLGTGHRGATGPRLRATGLDLSSLRRAAVRRYRDRGPEPNGPGGAAPGQAPLPVPGPTDASAQATLLSRAPGARRGASILGARALAGEAVGDLLGGGTGRRLPLHLRHPLSCHGP